MTTIRVDDHLSFVVETAAGPEGSAGTEAMEGLPPGAVPRSKPDPMRAAEESFAAVAAYLRRSALASVRPDEMTIEFAVALRGSAGLPVLVSAEAESTFKVTATWKGADQAQAAATVLADEPDRS